MTNSSGHDRLKVLLVEDHVAIARLTGRLIEEVDCTLVGPARCIADALRLAAEHMPDVALVDLSLPDGSGEDLISLLQARGIYCAVASAYTRELKQLGSLVHIPWLEKPVSIEELQKLVDDVASRRVDT